MARPTLIPRSPADYSNPNGQGSSDTGLHELVKLSGAYVAGVGVTGAGAWAYHGHVAKQWREEHQRAIKQMREESEARSMSRERTRAKEVEEAYERGKRESTHEAYERGKQEAAHEAYERGKQEATQEVYGLGKQEANPIEANHQRLLRCFEYYLPHSQKDFRYKTQEEYEYQVWAFCGRLQSIDMDDPAYKLGPRKTGLLNTGIDLARPRPPMQPLGEGAQQSGNQGSTPPRKEEGEPGGSQMSPFSFVKNEMMIKVQTLGQNLARIAGAAAAKSTNHGPPSTGFVGGVKAQAPAVRPAVPPL